MCATCTWIFVPAWRKKPAQNRSQIRRRKHRRERDDAETGRSMMGVPKIVLGRLRRASNPGNHPGADLLTAFAEQALAKRERLHVLEHLAHCSDFLEIIFAAITGSALGRIDSLCGRGWRRCDHKAFGAEECGNVRHCEGAFF